MFVSTCFHSKSGILAIHSGMGDQNRWHHGHGSRLLEDVCITGEAKYESGRPANNLPPFASSRHRSPQFSRPRAYHQAPARRHGRVRDKVHPWPRGVSGSVEATYLICVHVKNTAVGMLSVSIIVSTTLKIQVGE